MDISLRIGTRESQLALWQANEVAGLLSRYNVMSTLVPVSSEGDVDLTTPLYEMGVQGIFTRSLDLALLRGDIDIAVHSMKDVPTTLARGIQPAAILPRASFLDIFVPGTQDNVEDTADFPFVIATSSIRRKAQWLNRYPLSIIENLRGNVNTRLRKVAESHWHGAIFAAAGLERIALRPHNAIDLTWMLPAPAQGAIMVVCREDDEETLAVCQNLNDSATAICTAVERDFLSSLMGGCATPISALAVLENDNIVFSGNMLSPDGRAIAIVNDSVPVADWMHLGQRAAAEIMANGGSAIKQLWRNGGA